MKRTTLAIALALLVAAATPFALAQDETPTPAPEASPEMTVSEKTESADPSVSVSTERDASPSPTPKPESSPAATKDSSPAAAKSKPSATPAPDTSTAAVMPTKKSTHEATIRDIEDKWEASIMRHDPSVAQAYLADDFRGISSQGKVMTKTKLLAEIKKDTDTYTSAKNGKVDVRVFGGQFAVATGISTEAGKSKDGKDFKRSFRWTDAWVLRNGKWQCVASQAMLVK
jgi:ketosteroid isomerase-like protein